MAADSSWDDLTCAVVVIEMKLVGNSGVVLDCISHFCRERHALLPGWLDW